MRRYIYISDTKVDMILEQIPGVDLKRLAYKMKIELGVLSFSVERTADQSNRFSRLEAALHYLRSQEDIGTVDDPAAFFEETLPMRYGPYLPDKGVTLFMGRTTKTVLLLGGSSKHNVGFEDRGLVGGYSGHADILKILSDDLSSGVQVPEQRFTWDEENAIRMAFLLAHNIREGPVLEFVAQRHVGPTALQVDVGQWDDPVLIGSPLFVARVD